MNLFNSFILCSLDVDHTFLLI
uniref:Uncharacterized protein n=1 Tax=Arundo donax TaxID=35708 RepID=A0A0A9BMS8_ARUDO